ncbi:MAG: ribosome assembly cofactor RimP [Chitinophagaceae bacterium]
MTKKKGNEIVPFFIYQMNSTSLQERLEQMVNTMLSGHEDYFLVDLKIVPGNNIKVVLDADSGVSIDKCVEFNRYLYKQIEEEGLFTDNDFGMEVSSPGVDEPLKLDRQYRKNVGRLVEVILKDGSKKEGKLIELTETGLVIEETRGKNPSGKPGGKKKETVIHNIPFTDVKTTKVQVVF